MNRFSKLTFPVLTVVLVALMVACESDNKDYSTNSDSPQPKSPAVEFHEAVVIGSGYGGAVSSYRLGSAGIETVVVEKGRRWTVVDPYTPASTFATEDTILEGFLIGTGSDRRAVWLSDECFGNAYFVGLPFKLLCGKDTGVMEEIGPTVNRYDFSPAIKTNGIKAWAGVGVGGGSLINNGITYRPLRESWEYAYDLEAMPIMDEIWNDLTATYFDRVENFFHPEPIPADILATPYYESTRVHMDTMITAGYPMTDNRDGNHTHGTQLLPMIVDWDAVREELAGLRAPAVIDGQAWFGINSGAKRSLDTEDSYLGLAEATGKVEIRPLHTVTAIEFDNTKSLYGVHITQTDDDYNEIGKSILYTPSLIVSAGSIGTTKLMVAAKNTGKLPDLNEHVGTFWSNNGNTFTLRKVTDKRISQGGPAGTKSTNLDDPNAPIVIENLAQKAALVLEQNDQTSGIASPVLGSILTIAVGVPEKVGSFSWNDDTDTVDLTWPVDASKNIYDRFYSIMDDLEPYGHALPLELEQAQQFTLHPLGGMPIGLATDNFCRVKNYTGLYAVDGSLIPGSSALANPSLLIASLAERCMDNVVADIEARRNVGKF